MKLNRNIKLFINYFLGPALFIWLSYSIYHQVRQQPDLSQSWKHIRASLGSPIAWNLLLVIGLMVVNWSLEALKWKLSISSIQQVSFLTAFKAILSGVSFSVSTPNRIGEYLGRVLYMEEGNRIKAISLTIVGSLSQLLITLLMGCIGFLQMLPLIESGQILASVWIRAILYGVLAVIVVLFIFYFRLSWLAKWISRLPKTAKYIEWVQAVGELENRLLWRILLISLLRYSVFILQYYLLFQLFAVEISWWQACWSVSVAFLILAIIPTFAIAELAQRGYIAKTIIGLYSGNITGIIFTTASIWVINLVLPAIAGSLLILGIRRIFKNQHDRS